MDLITQILDEISSLLWGYPMIILLIGTHLFLTIRLKFPQRKIFTAIKLSVTKDDSKKGDVSQFGALATALAATIGTGNIVGVGTAIALGGPGAVLWCWITGVLGIATKYGEGLLAVKYRKVSKEGHMIGGPMYALEYGLKAKWAGILFAVFTALAAFGIGSTVQANAISTLANEVFHVDTIITGAIVTVLVGLVLIGGIKSIAKVCTALVPFMALIYVIGCIYILFLNADYIWPAVKLICTSAFSMESVGGGFVGSTIMIAARYGIARGLFSNESGLGSAPLVAAAAKTKNPVRQALVSSSGTFWDTVIICAITGVVIVSSVLSFDDAASTMDGSVGRLFQNLLQVHTANMDGSVLTKLAFNKIPVIGGPLLVFGLFTFAFTTILGWAIYSERAVEYLLGYKAVKIYVWLFLIAVFAGSAISLNTVWTLADIFNALMAIPNLLALLLLSNVLVKDTDKYLWGNRLDEVDEDMEK
ncbi:MAG: sodium:alanine symporter family protein [Prevotella sp.]|nr:sodium:alanine symporter family protein [Candidatus Prevotella equi]